MQSNDSTLQKRQAALVNMIFAAVELNPNAKPNSSRKEKGLAIYQNNLLMTATRALSLNYPVLEKMLGQETIRLLNRHLLQVEIPNSGDWADFGKGLAGLIKTTPLHSEHPYLADMAELEWLLNKAARAPGTELDTASLSRLSESDLNNIFLHLSGSLALLQSSYQVDELWRLHQFDSETAELDKTALLRLINAEQQDSYFVVYQKDHLPCIKRLTAEEYRWFTSVKQGRNLASLLEAHPDFDFSQWLSTAIEQQWLHKLS